MMSLHEFQSRFYKAVLYEEIPSDLLGAINAPESLTVYRNNVYQNFRALLEATYPVIQRLVGSACARSLMVDYTRLYPSASGDLQGFGRYFPDYLETRYRGSEFDYLVDVARLEWSYQEVLTAADASSIEPESLVSMGTTDYEQLCFDLHPACRIVASEYPVLRIWRANQPTVPQDDTIDLSIGGECVLVHRTSSCVEMRVLEPGECTFLSELSAGSSLGAALEPALEDTTDFDVDATLSRAFAIGLFVDCRIDEDSFPNE